MFPGNIACFLIDHQGEQRQEITDRKINGKLIGLRCMMQKHKEYIKRKFKKGKEENIWEYNKFQVLRNGTFQLLDEEYASFIDKAIGNTNPTEPANLPSRGPPLRKLMYLKAR